MVAFTITPIRQRVTEGESVSFRISIINPNYDAIGSYKIYWRTNSTASNAASSSDYDANSSLQEIRFSSSSAQSVQFSLKTFTDNRTEGDEFFEIDLYDNIGNYISGSATVFTIVDSAPARPDLGINNFSPSSYTVAAGGQLTAQVSIGNHAEGSVGSFSTRFYLSPTSTIDPSTATVLATSSGNSVGSQSTTGWSQLLNIPASLAPGTYYLGVWADYNDAIAESNNSNNSYSTQITIKGPAKPDLGINNFSPSSYTVAAGGQLTAQVSIGNHAEGSVGSFSTRFYLSPTSTIDPSTATVLATSSGNSVGSQSTTGWSQLLNIPASFAPGTYYLGVWADYNNVVSESENNNNSQTTPITITAVATGPVASGKQIIPLPYDASVKPLVSGPFGHDKVSPENPKQPPNPPYAAFLFNSIDFAFSGQPVLSVGYGKVISTENTINTNGASEADPSAIGNFVTIYFSDPNYPNYMPEFILNGRSISDSISPADRIAAHGFYASYFHLTQGSLTVSKGDEVRLGEVIGLPGNTGKSSSTHLHFEVGTDLVSFRTGWVTDAGSGPNDLPPVRFETSSHGVIDKFIEGFIYTSTNHAIQPKVNDQSITPQIKLAIDNITREPAGTMQNAILQAQLETSHKLSSEQLSAILLSALGTTSVATLSYQFFTGRIPTSAGLDYLVSSAGPNANSLNSPYYETFNLENRYINFAVNLGKYGDAKSDFLEKYGNKSLTETAKSAYAIIFGGTPTIEKVNDLIGGRIDYFSSYGRDGPEGIGTKAALVGWLLAEAAKADIGMFAKANSAFLNDLADGANLGVNLVGAYGKPEFAFGGT